MLRSTVNTSIIRSSRLLSSLQERPDKPGRQGRRRLDPRTKSDARSSSAPTRRAGDRRGRPNRLHVRPVQASKNHTVRASGPDVGRFPSPRHRATGWRSTSPRCWPRGHGFDDGVVSAPAALRSPRPEAQRLECDRSWPLSDSSDYVVDEGCNGIGDCAAGRQNCVVDASPTSRPASTTFVAPSGIAFVTSPAVAQNSCH